mmetsp:Transcript_20826/g.23202  ORF Transcript_20826/g.23202 Transcript_20826/m.23202 type:complete len:99 (-) Transcript_20826:522-818(-)
MQQVRNLALENKNVMDQMIHLLEVLALKGNATVIAEKEAGVAVVKEEQGESAVARKERKKLSRNQVLSVRALSFGDKLVTFWQYYIFSVNIAILMLPL